MSKSSKINLRSIALLGVAAVMAGSFGLIASPAMAAPGDGGQGSITVHKYEQPAGSIGANDGSELAVPLGTKPLAAGFTACYVTGLNLSTPGAYDRIKTMKASISGGVLAVTEGVSTPTPVAVTCGAERVTDSGTGATTFENLNADRVYVVWESKKPDGATVEAAPAILTLPYTSATDPSGFTYNPHIYPKNVIAGAGSTKDGVILGENAEWTITVPVRPLGLSLTTPAVPLLYSQFEIHDSLFDASFSNISTSLTLQNAAKTPVTLTSGTDYTINTVKVAAVPGPPAVAALSRVSLVFTPAGLLKLDANINGIVTFKINAKVIAAGSLANTADVRVNGASGSVSVPAPEIIHSGFYVTTKAVNVGGAKPALLGAEYTTYEVPSGVTACPATIPGTFARAFEKEVSTLVSGEAKTQTHMLGAGLYCVYQVVTPVGYKPFSADGSGQLVTVDKNDVHPEFLNVQIGSVAGDLPNLPLTGAQGSMLVLGGGSALLLVGGLLFAARRRRNTQDA